MSGSIIGGVDERFSTDRNKQDSLLPKNRSALDEIERELPFPLNYRQIRGFESALKRNLADLEVFNLTNIRATDGGPEYAKQAINGETLADFDTRTVAQFWIDNGIHDIAFDADIEPEGFDIGQDELRFDIDEWGSMSNRWATYDSAEAAYPGIIPVKEAFPEAEVSGRLWFRKPEEAIDLYNEAIEYVGEGDVDVHDDNVLGEAIRQMSGEYPSTITGEEALERINQGRAAVMDDVADRMSEAGIELVPEKGSLEDEDGNYQTYDDLVAALEEDEVDPAILYLEHPDSGVEVELSLWAEDDYTFSPENGPSDVGYMLLADGERGIRVMQDLYQRFGE